MSLPLEFVLLAVWLHFVADFILQSDWMAMNKSSSVVPLTVHVLVYSVVLAFGFGWFFALINGCLHWLTDFVSSRITKRLWNEGSKHWFFVVIGADQAVHLSCLLGTLALMYEGIL